MKIVMTGERPNYCTEDSDEAKHASLLSISFQIKRK